MQSSNEQNNNSESSVAALLLQKAEQDIYDSTWYDCTFDNQQPGQKEAAGENSPWELEQVDEILAECQRSLEPECPQTSKVEEKKPSSNHFKFDPLSVEESRALERALRMSKYMPELVNPDTSPEYEVKYRANSRNGKGTRINKETGKRMYNSVRGNTTREENRAAKEVFRRLCTSMLPRRHFDWILANLTHPNTDMLRLPKDLLIPMEEKGLVEEAVQSLENGKIPMEHSAIVLYALAKASGVDVSDVSITDPVSSLKRRQGRPRKEVQARVAAQSDAVVKSFKTLFPNYFRDVEGNALRHAFEKLQQSGAPSSRLRDEIQSSNTVHLCPRNIRLPSLVGVLGVPDFSVVRHKYRKPKSGHTSGLMDSHLERPTSHEPARTADEALNSTPDMHKVSSGSHSPKRKADASAHACTQEDRSVKSMHDFQADSLHDFQDRCENQKEENGVVMERSAKRLRRSSGEKSISVGPKVTESGFSQKEQSMNSAQQDNAANTSYESERTMFDEIEVKEESPETSCDLQTSKSQAYHAASQESNTKRQRQAKTVSHFGENVKTCETAKPPQGSPTKKNEKHRGKRFPTLSRKRTHGGTDSPDSHTRRQKRGGSIDFMLPLPSFWVKK